MIKEKLEYYLRGPDGRYARDIIYIGMGTKYAKLSSVCFTKKPNRSWKTELGAVKALTTYEAARRLTTDQQFPILTVEGVRMVVEIMEQPVKKFTEGAMERAIQWKMANLKFPALPDADTIIRAIPNASHILCITGPNAVSMPLPNRKSKLGKWATYSYVNNSRIYGYKSYRAFVTDSAALAAEIKLRVLPGDTCEVITIADPR